MEGRAPIPYRGREEQHSCIPPSIYFYQSCMHPQLEFSVNDGSQGPVESPIRRAYERLVRKLLELPNRPAVVLLQTFSGFKDGTLCAAICNPKSAIMACRWKT